MESEPPCEGSSPQANVAARPRHACLMFVGHPRHLCGGRTRDDAGTAGGGGDGKRPTTTNCKNLDISACEYSGVMGQVTGEDTHAHSTTKQWRGDDREEGWGEPDLENEAAPSERQACDPIIRHYRCFGDPDVEK